MLPLMAETAKDDQGDRPAPEHSPEPLIRVLRGTPTPEEVAAVVGVLLRHTRPAAASQPVAASLWAASARPGFARRPGTWRAGALPGIRVL
jgi:hypothetical protein